MHENVGGPWAKSTHLLYCMSRWEMVDSKLTDWLPAQSSLTLPSCSDYEKPLIIRDLIYLKNIVFLTKIINSPKNTLYYFSFFLKISELKLIVVHFWQPWPKPWVTGKCQHTPSSGCFHTREYFHTLWISLWNLWTSIITGITSLWDKYSHIRAKRFLANHHLSLWWGSGLLCAVGCFFPTGCTSSTFLPVGLPGGSSGGVLRVHSGPAPSSQSHTPELLKQNHLN